MPWVGDICDAGSADHVVTTTVTSTPPAHRWRAVALNGEVAVARGRARVGARGPCRRGVYQVERRDRAGAPDSARRSRLRAPGLSDGTVTVMQDTELRRALERADTMRLPTAPAPMSAWCLARVAQPRSSRPDAAAEEMRILLGRGCALVAAHLRAPAPRAADSTRLAVELEAMVCRATSLLGAAARWPHDLTTADRAAPPETTITPASAPAELLEQLTAALTAYCGPAPSAAGPQQRPRPWRARRR